MAERRRLPSLKAIRNVLVLWIAAVCLLAATGCKTTKNTAASRNWQAFNTRYNVYFNGDQHYRETLGKMEASYEDDYSVMLPTHPAEARGKPGMPQPQGDFRRTIEKMQKAIQLHSIKKKPRKRTTSQKDKDFRNREEFNPFLHNAWLSIGRAQYMNGDFSGAASTFRYITRHFKWLPETVTEARLWEARCYNALDWTHEAENTLHLVKEKDLTTPRLKNLHDIAMGGYGIRSGQYEMAVPYIEAAAKSSRGSQKNRLWFLAGQLHQQLGHREKAREAFVKAGGGMATTYRAKFNALVKISEVVPESEMAKEIASLKRMAKYARNSDLLDRIYYAVGNLEAARGDTAKAKEYYIKAVEMSTRGDVDKALAQIALGNIYYNGRDYLHAQPCYSEAVPRLPQDYPNLQFLKMRSDVLDELAVFAGNVQLQDSLLTLARMSQREREEACRKLADAYVKQKKREQEEADRQKAEAERENIRQNTQPGDRHTDPVPTTATAAGKSWYFYNPAVRNAGKAEFQRRWGKRKLEDDWRRSNKSLISFEEGEYSEITDDRGGSDYSADDGRELTLPVSDNPAEPGYYLRQIPRGSDEIRNSEEIVQDGLYNMGELLKDKLNDPNAARAEFMRLLTDYPDNVYRPDVYRDLYIMAMREGNETDAEKWRLTLIKEFPDSPYAKAMSDPMYFDRLKRMYEIQEETYEKAYAAYLDNDNGEVHRLTRMMESDYPLSDLLPKFMFIDALSYLTENDTRAFNERAGELLRRWPEAEAAPIASDIMKGLTAGRKTGETGANARSMIWEVRLDPSVSADSLQTQEKDATFVSDPDSPHYLVAVFPLDSVNPNTVLYDVARFNFSSFLVRDFDLEPMAFSNVGLLVVKGFGNLREVEKYLTKLESADAVLPPGVSPVIISKGNFELLLREGRSFEEYFRFRDTNPPSMQEEGTTQNNTTP